MKALVVGASGLIGGALVRALSLAGNDVAGTFFSRARKGATIPLDVNDKSAVTRCVESEAPQGIFLAVEGLGGIGYWEGHRDEARRLHVTGTQHVVEAAARAGARLVYFSTDLVFGGTTGPFTEEEKPAPSHAFGHAKLEAEDLVRSASPHHLIVRTVDVLGWDRQSGNFAMLVWDRLQGGGSFDAANDHVITPTLADYLAEVCVRLFQAEQSGVFHVVCTEETTPADFARRLARALGLDAERVNAISSDRTDVRSTGLPRRGLQPKRTSEFLATSPPGLDDSIRRIRRQWRADTHTAPGPKAVLGPADHLRTEILARVRDYHALAHVAEEFVPFTSRVSYAGRIFGAEEMVNLVDSALDFWLTMGPYSEQFEQKLRRFFGARDALAVTSGSAANLNAVMSLLSPQLERSLVPGDEVITPAVTFPTTLAPIVHSGLVPVFVDCVVGSYNVDPKLLEDAISPRTRAIVVPHTLGNPCDMDTICELADRHDLYLVEDACDALASRFRGRLVGTFGHLATLSFYPAHHITTGEGGCVIVNDSRLARIARSVRDWGRDCWCAPGESNTCGKRFGWQCGDLPRGYDHKFIYSNLGYNFKPTDMQAAIGVAQLDRLDGFVAQRKRNFKRLYAGLQRHQDHLILPTLDTRSDPAWFGFPITVKGQTPRRRLIHWLERANIETREIFGGNILRQPGYRRIRHRVSGALEESDRVMRDSFFIGVYPGLSDSMIDFVLERFDDFFAQS